MSTYGSGAPGPTATPPQTNAVAILSLIFAFLFAPLGLIFGLVAIAQINKQPTRYVGKGLAIAGTIISALGIVLVGLLVVVAVQQVKKIGGDPSAMLREVERRYPEAGTAARCAFNQAKLGIAAKKWAAAHGDKLPPADRWVEELLPLAGGADTFKCAADKSGARSSYGMNAALSGTDLKSLPDAGGVVLFYETARPGDNPSGGPEDVAPPRHQGTSLYIFADFRSRPIGPGEVPSFGVGK